MRFRALTPLVAIILGLALAGCSGSGPAGGEPAPGCDSGDARAFCLTSCTLGCSLTGCSINVVAQNQPLTLQFNQDVDEFSVPPHKASILLQTATGEEPVGDWVVAGSVVTFVPTVQRSGGSFFFGFKPNETYGLHLPAGENDLDVIRSMSGTPLGSSITCSMKIGPIKDLNEVRPFATLVAPVVTTGAPVDTPIVLKFNEIIDPAPFFGVTGSEGPILFMVKSTEKNSAGVSVCRSLASGVVLDGAPVVWIDTSQQVTMVRFAPAQSFPGNKCVEIEVTPKIKDLSGKPAQTHILSFTTVDLGVQTKWVEEDFSSDLKLDKAASAGTWNDKDGVIFFQIGGDGKHGPFVARNGKLVSAKNQPPVYEWDTENMVIPMNQTLSGKDEHVTDGIFKFSTFDLPLDGKGRQVTVRFVGKNPVRITVRGNVNIQGHLLANGVDIPLGHKGVKLIGEPGGASGPAGGGGGKGSNQADGIGPNAKWNGEKGADIRLSLGHAYGARAKDTGGPGGSQWPTHGLTSKIVYSFSGVVSVEAGSGGGGGGNAGPGGKGTSAWTGANVGWNSESAPDTPGAKALGWDIKVPTYTPTTGTTHRDHYMVGGSGGGGAGSCSLGTIATTGPKWHSARAGSGGGGALGLRLGGNLTMDKDSSIEARGGAAAPTPFNAFSDQMPIPGGGGSGGAIFLQVLGATKMLGLLDASGGKGGQLVSGTVGILSGSRIFGGDGGPGIIRMETFGSLSKVRFGTTKPVVLDTDVQLLPAAEKDDLIGVQSLWYSTTFLFPPEFVRYEVEAEIDGEPVLYSDDPSIPGAILAQRGVTPVIFMVQGALVVVKGNLVEPKGLPTPWRTYVGAFSTTKALADDKATGFRFLLIRDSSFNQTVKVKKVTVFYKI